jgi:SAM-dependent methyltransferase
MNKFSFLCKEIIKGKSVTRSFLNYRLQQESLQGETIDIGGGRSADYLSFMDRTVGVNFRTFDVKVGEKIDFEKDALPANNDSYDTVLFLNVMEHVFNYQHIADEVVRIIKPNGNLIGFVPFLMWYHPDHRDFFRYTHEALEIILRKAGGKKILIEFVGFGPFVAASQMVVGILPRPFALILFSINYLFDCLYLKLKPSNHSRHTLGYLFLVSK